MANENNNINNLVSYPDDDPTVELEIPEVVAAELRAAAEAHTSDAAPAADTDGDTGEGTVEILSADLVSSAERIGQLQDEVEALQSRSSDFERQARKASTEIDGLRETLRVSEEELATRQAKLESLENSLSDALEKVGQSAGEARQVRQAAKDDRNRIFELEKQLAAGERKIAAVEEELAQSVSVQDEANREAADTESRIAVLEAELEESRAGIADANELFKQREAAWESRESEFGELRTSLERAEEENRLLARQVDSGRQQLRESRAEIEKLYGRLDDRIDACESLRLENRELRQQLESGTGEAAARNQQLLAEQAGQLQGYAQDVRDLEARLEGTERYSDDLRRKLGRLSEETATANRSRQNLQSSLASAQIKIGALSESLRVSETAKSDMEEKLSKDGEELGREIQRLRDDLELAQETVIDQTVVNEQLESDLADNKSFRQALEVQIRETEEKFERKVRHLEQKANRLRNQANEYERKLKNKDNAISALMNELANRTSKLEAMDDIENVIQEIDQRNSRNFRRPPSANIDRERVTRLLVGKMDGQELRFPLFKNRLTIGRTPHNDIQLNAQFISRRHAVIVSESKGTRIVDWGSKNGVFVNDKRVTERMLTNGDIVTIGTTEFRFEERPKR